MTPESPEDAAGSKVLQAIKESEEPSPSLVTFGNNNNISPSVQ